MNKFYLIFIEIWLVMLCIIAFIGINYIFKFDYTGFFSLLYVISSIILIVGLMSKIEQKRVKEILTDIKMISKLDYQNLKNISKIDFTITGDYFVFINRNNKEISFKLEKDNIPKNQKMLIELDEKYNDIRINTNKK